MFIGKTCTVKGKKAYSTTEIRKIGVVKTKEMVGRLVYMQNCECSKNA